MGIKKYIKRGIKYIMTGHKQPIIYADISEKTPNDIFKEKVMLVTGGGGGLGYYIAKKLTAEGAFVIITGRNEEKLKNAKETFEKNCDYISFDVMDIEKGQQIIDDIFSKYGKLDCLVNNAGISLHEDNIENVTKDGFEKQFATNLEAGYFLSQRYIINYKKYNQKTGNIIFISSERGSQCDDIPYGLTKAAVNSFVKGLSRRYYKDGIRVNAVAPGVTASEMTSIKKEDDLFSENASGRFFVPEEVAETVSFIASDYSKCISGEIINCDAGQYLNPWFN